MGNAVNKMRNVMGGRRRAFVPGPPPANVGERVEGVQLGQPLSGLSVAGEWQEYNGEVMKEDDLPATVKAYPVGPKVYAGLW